MSEEETPRDFDEKIARRYLNRKVPVFVRELLTKQVKRICTMCLNNGKNNAYIRLNTKRKRATIKQKSSH